MPVEVLSAKPGQSYMSYYKLDIDIHKCAGAAAACSDVHKHLVQSACIASLRAWAHWLSH